jgi:type II secretory pathway component PulF
MNTATNADFLPIYTEWRLNRPWRFGPIKAQRKSLLQVLAISFQPSSSTPQLPVNMLLRLYLQEEATSYRKKVQQLVDRLESGLTLADSIEQTPELLCDEDILAIRLASQSGTLPETLDHLCHSYDNPETWRREGSSWPYYLTLVFVFCLLIAFLKGLILPTFEEILRELDMQATPSFQLLNGIWATIGMIALPLVAVGSLAALWLSNRSGYTRWLRHAVGSWVSLNRHRLAQSKTLLMLCESMQRGRPVLGTLGTLAKYHFDSRVRSQLLIAKNEIELGASMPESFLRVGLLTEYQAKSLSKLDSNAEQGWLLSKIAKRNWEEAMHRRRMMKSLVHPIVIGMFGLVTLLACVGVISVLVKLISSLA